MNAELLAERLRWCGFAFVMCNAAVFVWCKIAGEQYPEWMLTMALVGIAMQYIGMPETTPDEDEPEDDVPNP